jgi:hypothetical protein
MGLSNHDRKGPRDPVGGRAGSPPGRRNVAPATAKGFIKSLDLLVGLLPGLDPACRVRRSATTLAHVLSGGRDSAPDGHGARQECSRLGGKSCDGIH